MSGGVDSSVVAALLARSGHEVIGITLQLYDHGEAVGRKGACCAGQDVQDARRVAQVLGIPHYVLDYEKRFADAVMQFVRRELHLGRDADPVRHLQSEDQVPRPARDSARARRRRARHRPLHPARATARRCRRSSAAADADRDQSYFLFATTREQLAASVVPARRHDEERGAGARARARPARRRQVGQPGHLLRAEGPLQRRHRAPEARRAASPATSFTSTAGASAATTASSTTPSASAAASRSPPAKPLFVIRLDAQRNEVVVGPRDFLRTQSLVLKNFNWLGDGELNADTRPALEVYARIRSSQAPQPATLDVEADGTVTVSLRDGENGVAVGQACVVYCRRLASGSYPGWRVDCKGGQGGSGGAGRPWRRS